MKRNSTTIFIEVPGSVIPVPWISNAPDFTGFTDPTLSVLQSTWASYTGPIEVISDPLSGWDGGSAETQLPSISLNGVTIFAAPNPSLYPTERPNGQPLIAGDIVWDALAQDWVRWNGSEWNSEIKAIVKSDGLGGYIINYDFRTATEPTIRPDGLAIQEGDRWERPGFFVAYRDANGNWISAISENAFYSGTLESIQSTTVLRSGGNFSDIDSDANNTLYMLSGTANFTFNSLDVSTDFGQTWNVLNTFSPIASTSTIGTTFYINRVTGSFYSVGTGFMVSRDQGATWIDPGFGQTFVRGVLYIKSNGDVVGVSSVFNSNVHLTTDDFVSRSTIGNVTTDIPAITSTSGITGVMVDDNTLLLAPLNSSNLGIARSTDGGVTWTHVITTGGYTLADHKGLDGTIYGTLTGTGSVYSTDGGLTWLPGGVGLASLIDDVGTVYYVNKPNGDFNDTLSKSPYSINNVNSDIQHFRFNAFIQGFEVSYSSSGTNDASNYYIITFEYKESADVSWTTVQITLNSPYPSPTLASVYFPINEYWTSGGMFRFAGATIVGDPSPVELTIVATGNRIYV